jgi:hypothetical protein
MVYALCSRAASVLLSRSCTPLHVSSNGGVMCVGRVGAPPCSAAPRLPHQRWIRCSSRTVGRKDAKRRLSAESRRRRAAAVDARLAWTSGAARRRCTFRRRGVAVARCTFGSTRGAGHQRFAGRSRPVRQECSSRSPFRRRCMAASRRRPEAAAARCGCSAACRLLQLVSRCGRNPGLPEPKRRLCKAAWKPRRTRTLAGTPDGAA